MVRSSTVERQSSRCTEWRPRKGSTSDEFASRTHATGRECQRSRTGTYCHRRTRSALSRSLHRRSSISDAALKICHVAMAQYKNERKRFQQTPLLHAQLLMCMAAHKQSSSRTVTSSQRRPCVCCAGVRGISLFIEVCSSASIHSQRIVCEWGRDGLYQFCFSARAENKMQQSIHEKGDLLSGCGRTELASSSVSSSLSSLTCSD